MGRDELKTVLQAIHREICRPEPCTDAIHAQLLRLKAVQEPEDGYAARKLRKIVNECEFIEGGGDDAASRLLALQGDIKLLLQAMDR
ncbi:MAG: hypothetical protein R3270_02720 [Gammaproteobacteria bacterium]|nr:hypothetical protein [Gammaproteobacteria bacterium]